MLQPVAMGQTRFVLPGLSVDERGVALGRRLLCLFPDVAHALAFIRTLSRQGALKDLLASLEMLTVAARSGLREVAVGFDVQGSFQADGCASAARAHQGAVFTGAEPHHVPYRDSAQPLGVDVADPSSLLAVDSGHVLYTSAGADVRAVLGPLHLKDLLMRMAPVALRPADLRESRPESVLFRVPRGLLPAVERYLWRRRVAAEVCVVRRMGEGAFDAGAEEVGLVRCRELPAGVLSMLEGTPGIQAFEPVLESVFVQRGFRHPVALEACASMFPREEVLLVRGGRAGQERVAGPLRFVALDDAATVELLDERGTVVPPARVVDVVDVAVLGVEVRLIPDALARGSAEAVLVPSSRLPDLQALVHLLPEVLWHGCMVALAEPFSVILSPAGVRALPIGHALAATHARVFVPVGMRFSPRLTDDLAAAHFGLQGNDNIIFFPPPGMGGPFAMSRAAFVPLSRAAVHPESLEKDLEVVTRVPGLSTAGEPVVFHPPRGALASWDTGTAPVDAPPALPPRR